MELYGLKLKLSIRYLALVCNVIEWSRWGWFVIMSLFSRLKDQTRARDSQDDPKDKTKAADKEEGGLFGSIQLKPATGEPSVPPPGASPSGATPSGATPRENSERHVPSLEEARAEFDRARAEHKSGLFRRDPALSDDDTTPRAPSAPTPERESVRFGAVSLPPLDSSPSITAAPEARVPEISLPAIAASEDKPFRVPSLSQFADSEAADSPLQPANTAPSPATSDAELGAQAVAESGEQTVFAPTPLAERTPIAERTVVARSEPQTVAPEEIVTVVEQLRSDVSSPVPDAPAQATASTEAPVVRPVEPPAPSARPTNSSTLTPFQRLMAARAAQGGPPVSRPRIERPAPVERATPPVETPTVEAPTVETPTVETPTVETPTVETPTVETPPVEAPSLETAQIEVPRPETPQREIPAVAALATEIPPVEVAPVEAPSIEAPSVETPALETPQIEVPQADAPQSVTTPVKLPQVEAPRVAISEAEMPPLESAGLISTNQISAVEAPSVPSSEFATPAVESSRGQFSSVELPPAQTEAEAPAIEVPRVEWSEPDAVVETPAVEMPESTITRAAETPEAKAAVPEAEERSLGIEESALRDFERRMAELKAANSSESFVTNAQDADDQSEADAEAEIVPEQTGPQDVTDQITGVGALSLADRLARAPRAELEAAHAEAEALTPEVLAEVVPKGEQESAPSTPAKSETTAETMAPQLTESDATNEEVVPPETASAPSSRTAVPLSFAERLAARNRVQSEAQPAIQPAIQPEPQPELPPAVNPSDDEASAPETPMNSASPAPNPPAPEAPRRAVPRTFSERLAARTSLDRHLQVPAEEAAPTSSDLANANTELARIDEGAQLSEREMKNRVLFRQKYLIFDSVIGSIDQRVLQNPTRETVKPYIERGVDGALREFNLNLEGSERNWMVDEFVRETTDLGALVPLLEDPSVSKIVVTGAKDVSVERLGRIERTGVSFRDDDHLLSLVRRIAEMSGGRVDAKVPLLDRPLPDGGRIRAKVPPLAPQPTLTIEKSTGNPFVALKRQMDEKSRGESLPYAQLRERIQQKLLREFEGDAAALAGDQDKLRSQVEEMIGAVIAEEHVVVTRAERASLVMDLLNEIVGLGPIEPLLNDPDVDEVMVNGPYQIYVERKGKLELTSQRFRDNAHVMQVIDRIVAPLGRRVDEKSPMVDGRLRDGSRFNAIIPPLALSGPTMTIRKFARDPFTMSDLINFGSMTREAAQFLQAAVEGRLNIVVSGGTGSGKTTTLNVLSSFIPSTERIVTIEDAAELQMRQEHVIRMETRPPNIEGVGEVGIRDLVRNSLRMRPDRIVVGECRGGEALDMLQAMNTGHDGSLTTAHSNGPRDTCKRLETMVMMAGFDLPVRAIREQISMAVQLVVHQERMRDGKRRVTAITEIVGMEGDVLTLQDIFRFEQEGIDDDGRIIGSLQATGMRPKYYETIIDNGVQISMDLFTPKAHEAAPRSRMQERGGR